MEHTYGLENIRKNTKTSAMESLGYELKHHNTRFDKNVYSFHMKRSELNFSGYNI
jgi:hypothetical protein